MSPKEIVQTMLSRDAFSAWMGLQVSAIRRGYCQLNFRVKPEMLNGFNKLHGGLLFSASDSALAFAANAHGRHSVALDAHISFLKPVLADEVLSVEAAEVFLGNRTGVYDIRTVNARAELVASFKGTVYRSSQTFLPPVPPDLTDLAG